MIQIKICGITRKEEAVWLNEAGVDYAGFVFFEKSKRNVSIAQAKQIAEKLNSNIRKIAVTVSPDILLVEQLQEAGFDVLQVHGELREEVQKQCRIPIWRALNLKGVTALGSLQEELRRWRCTALEMGKIQAVLVDAGDYGSGKTFGWENDDAEFSEWKQEIQKIKQDLKNENILFVLAGGLSAGNVADGIRIFAPDVVDVSSGVEADTEVFSGKSKEKLEVFVQAVRDMTERKNTQQQ